MTTSDSLAAKEILGRLLGLVEISTQQIQVRYGFQKLPTHEASTLAITRMSTKMSRPTDTKSALAKNRHSQTIVKPQTSNLLSLLGYSILRTVLLQIVATLKILTHDILYLNSSHPGISSYQSDAIPQT